MQRVLAALHGGTEHAQAARPAGAARGPRKPAAAGGAAAVATGAASAAGAGSVAGAGPGLPGASLDSESDVTFMTDEAGPRGRADSAAAGGPDSGAESGARGGGNAEGGGLKGARPGGGGRGLEDVMRLVSEPPDNGHGLPPDLHGLYATYVGQFV